MKNITGKIMITLEQQLKRFPPEFTMAVEKYKLYDFDKGLSYILTQLNVADDFNDMDKDMKGQFVEFLKAIFMFGFYSGVRFTLDPDKFEQDKQDEG